MFCFTNQPAVVIASTAFIALALDRTFFSPPKQISSASVHFYSEEEVSNLSRKDLEKEFLALQRTNQRLDFRTQAKKAEDYVAEKVNGQLCGSIHSSYDVLSGNGHKLEVKLSILIQPNKAGSPSSTVWKWNRLFGDDRRKIYDRLILVGLATQRSKNQDQHNGLEPRSYEFFDFSFEEVQDLARDIRHQILSINTNRSKANAIRGRIVWEHHIEEEELVRRYSKKVS
jgi:hypothetical protein